MTSDIDSAGARPEREPGRHVACVVARAPEAVYAFAADVDNLPRWAAGLASGAVTRDGETLVVDSPLGRVTVRFVPPNEFGVLDHDVTLPDGTTVHNPLRVLPHPRGAEVVFTIRRLDASDEEFDRDTEMVAADLARLRDLLESDLLDTGR